MKRIFICSVILIFILSLCGCKRETVDDSPLFVSETNPSKTATAGSAEQEGTQTVVESTKQKSESGKNEEQNDSQSNSEQSNIVSIEKNGDETVYRYDPDQFSKLPSRVSETTLSMPADRTYSELMSLIGSNGIIAAGYATGQREAHDRMGSIPYILTDFIVTDLYYGTETATTVKIKEDCRFVLENEEAYYLVSSSDNVVLKNKKQVLLFLAKNRETGYYSICYTIPLEEDYRNYNDAYLTSLLDFFRGDKTEYRNQGTTTGAQPTPSTVVDGETVYTYDLIPTFFWPEREISDEALLAEMSDHAVVRTATEYKIAIWPYGHKNYTGGYGTSAFHRSCKP